MAELAARNRLFYCDDAAGSGLAHAQGEVGCESQRPGDQIAHPSSKSEAAGPEADIRLSGRVAGYEILPRCAHDRIF